MSLLMTDLAETLSIAQPTIPGVLIGILGCIMAVINYPIHKKWLSSRKKKYGKDILRLSDKILNA